MDDATIQKIAAEIIRHLPSYVWALLLVQALVAGVVGAISAFALEYLKTRGKYLATKADFESLQQQLRGQTELVETIKAEVGQKDWAKREWTNIRRQKLETLLERAVDCRNYIDRFQLTAVKGLTPSEDDPYPGLSAIATLYFPELKDEVAAFVTMHLKNRSIANDLATNVASAGGDSRIAQVAHEMFWPGAKESYMASLGALETLNVSGRKLMTKIMDIQ